MLENIDGITEVYAVLADIDLIFVFILFKAHCSPK